MLSVSPTLDWLWWPFWVTPAIFILPSLALGMAFGLIFRPSLGLATSMGLGVLLIMLSSTVLLTIGIGVMGLIGLIGLTVGYFAFGLGLGPLLLALLSGDEQRTSSN